jgi:hypothetical protein
VVGGGIVHSRQLWTNVWLECGVQVVLGHGRVGFRRARSLSWDRVLRGHW